MTHTALGRAIAFVVAASFPSTAHTLGDPRAYDGTRATGWPTDAAEPVEPVTPGAAASVPAPRVVPAPTGKRISVAVGLAPEAPGNAAERDWLDRLERSARVSPAPPTTVRRLRPGVGDARTICRDRRDDMVVMIGYVPRRDDAVVLPYDCLLDLPLGIRALAAVDEDALVGALWAEHQELQRNGVTERRRVGRLSGRARAGIAAGVAIVVIGVAVGLLVANALRDDEVVLKVSP